MYRNFWLILYTDIIIIIIIITIIIISFVFEFNALPCQLNRI